MQLSDFQKELVNKIIGEDLFDIDSFIVLSRLKQGEIKTYRIEADGEVTGRIIVHDVKSVKIEESDSWTSLRNLKDFISLWQSLDRSGLVITMPVRRQQEIDIIVAGKSHLGMNGMANAYYDKQIVPLPSLVTFKDRGYLTEEEYHIQVSEQNQKTSISLTRRVAYISLGVSIFVAIGTSIFNYVTYTAQRSVSITNPNAFRDTTKVILLNPDRIKADTLMVKHQTGLNNK